MTGFALPPEVGVRAAALDWWLHSQPPNKHLGLCACLSEIVQQNLGVVFHEEITAKAFLGVKNVLCKISVN